MSKLNIGIIGAGMIGDVHINNIRKDGRGEVTWIAARTQKTLDEKRTKFDIKNGTLNYQDMLADPDLDAVVVAAPPFLHLEMLEASLKAGKDVLLEKPMVTNLEDLEKLLEIIKTYPDQKVLECTCRHARLQPKFTFVKEIIDSGKIGEVYHIHHTALTRGTFIEYNPAGAWAHQKKYAGGGPFFDWGVYDLSFHLGLLNDKPQLVDLKSFTKNGLKKFKLENFESDVEEHGVAYLEFDNGLTYHYERGNGVQSEVPNVTRIFGTQGSLEFAFCSWDSPKVTLYTNAGGEEKQETLTIENPKDHDDSFELTKHFMDYLIDDVEPKMTIDTAAKHLKILFKILA